MPRDVQKGGSASPHSQPDGRNVDRVSDLPPDTKTTADLQFDPEVIFAPLVKHVSSKQAALKSLQDELKRVSDDGPDLATGSPALKTFAHDSAELQRLLGVILADGFLTTLQADAASLPVRKPIAPFSVEGKLKEMSPPKEGDIPPVARYEEFDAKKLFELPVELKQVSTAISSLVEDETSKINESQKEALLSLKSDIDQMQTTMTKQMNAAVSGASSAQRK